MDRIFKLKMMDAGTILVLLAMLLSLSACEKTGTASFSGQPVVEAYLAPGQKVRVVVSEKIPYDSTSTSGSSGQIGLDIVVSTGGIDFHLQSLGDGVYQDTAGIIPMMADSSYSLTFRFNGEIIQSATVIPSKPTGVTQSETTLSLSQFDPENPSGNKPPDPVVITFSNADDSYYMTTVECMESTLVPVFKDSVPENDIFASMPVNGNEIGIQPMQIRYFGLNRIILYHINPEYVQFFRHQASTSQYYEQPPTNITNGLGIFTGVNADTLYLQVNQAK